MYSLGLPELGIVILLVVWTVISIMLFIAPIVIWKKLTALNEKTNVLVSVLQNVEHVLRTSHSQQCPKCGAIVTLKDTKCKLCDSPVLFDNQ